MFKSKLNKIAERNPSMRNLINKLDKLINELDKKYSPEVIILHGSIASGKFAKGLSDIDIILITNYKIEPSFQLKSIDDVDVEMSIYNIDDVVLALKRRKQYFIEAVENGYVIKGEDKVEAIRKFIQY